MSSAITDFNYIPGSNLNLSSFSQADIAAAEGVVQQFIIDNFPGINVSRNSTLFNLAVRQTAAVYLMNRQMNVSLQQTQSLLGVTQNPSLAVNGVVDEILSNIFLTRVPGTRATGVVRVNVTSNSTYVINSSMTFTSSAGLVFNPTANYRATASPTDATQLPLYSTDATNTQFYFLVPVVAAADGVASQLLDGTDLVPAPTIPFFISSAAFGNFQGGTNDETNQALIARIPASMAARNMVSRNALSSVLQTEFPQILSVTAQGMIDPAMNRNTNFLGFKQGGYADLYIRSAQVPLYGTVQKTAILMGLDANNNGLYSVQLNQGDFPGHYFVSSIQPATTGITGSYVVLSETKGFNATVANPLTGQLYTPNRIQTLQQAVYTRYQTSEVQFQIDYDPSLGTPAAQFADTVTVNVTMTYMPNINDIQNFVLDRLQGVLLADYLVRAIIPCYVTMNVLKVRAAAGTSATQIQQAVFAYVNGLQPTQALRVDAIVQAILGVTGVTGVDLPIKLTGNIYAPDGTVIQLKGDSYLLPPTRPSAQIVPETVAFFLELAAIPVELITA